MGLSYRDDLFMLQVRMFRLAQARWGKDSQECETIFKEYDVNDYIRTCYEEYHVQGDEANIADIEKYLHKRGCRI
jgi:hypothetical protein